MLSSFPLKTLPEPHHYPHFTDRKQNQRDLKSFTQGHTANNRGGRSWNSNCLVPKAKFFLWNICLSCNPIVMSLLIFIIHGFSHSNVFWVFFFFFFQLMEKYPLFMKKMLASSPSDQWSSLRNSHPYSLTPPTLISPHPSHSPPQAGFPGWFSLSWKASWKWRGSCCLNSSSLQLEQSPLPLSNKCFVCGFQSAHLVQPTIR